VWLCIGELKLDRFVYGQVERVSPGRRSRCQRPRARLAMLGGARAKWCATWWRSGVERLHLGDRRRSSRPRGTQWSARRPAQRPICWIEPDGVTRSRPASCGSQRCARRSRRRGAGRAAIGQPVVRARRGGAERHSVSDLSDYGKGVLGADDTESLIAARAQGRQGRGRYKAAITRRYAGASVLHPTGAELMARRLATGTTTRSWRAGPRADSRAARSMPSW